MLTPDSRANPIVRSSPSCIAISIPYRESKSKRERSSVHPASCGKKRKLNGLVILAVIGRNLPFLLFSLVAVANRDETGGMMFLVLVLVLCWVCDIPYWGSEVGSLLMKLMH